MVPEPDDRFDQLRVGTTGGEGVVSQLTFPLSPFPSVSQETAGALFCVLGWPVALSPMDCPVQSPCLLLRISPYQP